MLVVQLAGNRAKAAPVRGALVGLPLPVVLLKACMKNLASLPEST